MNETKSEKFVRLAEKRVNNALKQISLIGNLANKNFYDYDKNQVIKIIKALKEEISKLEKEFDNYNSSINKFKL
jgi:hypothetical protein